MMKPGDVVALRGQEHLQLMTVGEVDEDKRLVLCVWFDIHSNVHEARLPIAALVVKSLQPVDPYPSAYSIREEAEQGIREGARAYAERQQAEIEKYRADFKKGE